MESEQNSTGVETEIPNGMQNLGELLAVDEQQIDDASGEDQAKSSGSDDETKLTKFNDLAGKTGMDLDALYALEIANSETGEPLTIEQLKDAHKNNADLELRTIEFEERMVKEQNDLTREKAELQEIMAALPEKALAPEVLERIRDKSDKTIKLERQKTLEVIPEWNDADTRQADIEGMTEHLQGYGFPVNYLSQVVNHQQLRYIRDNWLREQRIRKAMDKVRSGKPDKTATAKQQKSAPKKASVVNVKRGNARNKLEAVFSELD